jgi:putative ABC transport system ATP-binding protein
MLLELDRVSKRFATPNGERVALDGVSLELDRGQIVGVFGPSGSGKSTLLRVAAGLLAPDGGEVRFDGERIDAMRGSERKRLRRREISCVWSGDQEQQRLRVLDHVALALLVDGRDHRRAQRAAREALLACEVDHCAEMELATLSDGERQRVQIARAIVTEPRLLLADRPASSLSLVEQEAVMGLLAALAHEAKVAVLVADSDADALLCAQPILYMRDGKLVSNAPPAGSGRVYQFPARPRKAAVDA